MPVDQRQGIAKVQMRISVTRCHFNGALIRLNRFRHTAQSLQRNTLTDQRFHIARIKCERRIKGVDCFFMAVLAT